MTIRRVCNGWLCMLLLILSSHALALSDIALSSLAQKGRQYELIRLVQAELDSGREVSTFQYFLLGGAYYQVRKYRNAGAIAAAMERRIAAGDRSYYGSDLSVYPELFRAVISLDQGEYDAAIRHADLAYRQLQPNQPFYRSQLIHIAGTRGLARALLGQAEAARQDLEQIRTISLSMSNLGPEKHTAMARIHMALKEYDRALAAIGDQDAQVSGMLTLFYDPTFQDVPNFFIRAKSLYETGRAQQAKQDYDQLLQHPQIAQFGGIYWLILYDRARIALAEGDRDTAIRLLKRAVEVIEQQRSSIDSETGRIGFVGDKQRVYLLLVTQLLAAKQDGAAFEYVERSKARALVDLLAAQQTLKLGAKSAEAGNTLLQLKQAEADAVALPTQEQQSSGSRSRSVVAELQQRLRHEQPELAALVTVSNAPLAKLQGLLQPGEALLEYYYSDQELVAFVLTSTAVKAVKLQRAGLEQNLRKLRAALADPASNQYLVPARSLYQQLVQPLVALLPGRKLIIVPHGILHYLPFNALRSERGFLIDDYSVLIEPSAEVLDLLKARAHKPIGSALVLGNPDLGNPDHDLQYAQQEATAIAKLLPSAKVLLRGAATSGFVKSQGAQYSLLHFATHGVFSPTAPLDSALLLAPAPGNDGRLTVSDLYSLRLDAALVTLSACETALGTVSNGDDVVGFTRGFLYAGSRSIVSSLWSVDDQATEALMRAFYRNLASMDKREALRQAQLGTRQSFAHPFYWAAFQLTGRAD